jgi:arsenate reductase
MAEAIFNHLAPTGMRAISAGSRPAKEVKPLTLTALKEIGIDVDTLRPKLLTREMAERADRIITMGCPEACPAVGKPMEDWGIQDPSSGGIEEYRKTREIITRKVEHLLEIPKSEKTGENQHEEDIG